MTQKTSLVMKLTAMFIILVVVVAAIGALLAYQGASTAIKDTTRDALSSVAGVMATQVNVTELLSIRPGDEGSPVYVEIATQLDEMRSMNDAILNAYIMRVDPEGQITFIVDDFWLQDPEQAAKTGEIYSTPDSMQIFGALSVPTASDDAYTDKWGTFISGYAPIRDENGNTVAVLGIDMDGSDLNSRRTGVASAFIMTIIAGLIIGGGMIVFFARSVSKDIKSLTDAVIRIRDGERTVEIDTHRTDEIGELAKQIAELQEKLK
jgi:methyl-accepting chemotaxis protein